MTPKTVYFLGAGASKELFCLPVMNEFFKNFSVQKYESLSKFLSQYFFDGLKNKELEDKIRKSDKLNLEDVITFLELSLDRIGSFGKVPDSYLIEAKRDFNNFIRDMLNIEFNNKISELSKKINIFEKLSKRSDITQCVDSIVSLNYDLGFDNILYHFSDRNTSSSNLKTLDHRTILNRMYQILGKEEFRFGDFPTLWKSVKNSGFFLKLHGSLDWVYCPNQYCGNNQLFFVNWIDSAERHLNIGDICILCGSPLVSVIIPPTLAKSLEQFPKMGLIWSLAYRELCKADKIVIFGISFAPSDYYLRWLLKSSLLSNMNKPVIEVINKDETIHNEIKKITGIKLKIISFKSFDDYLNYINSGIKT